MFSYILSPLHLFDTDNDAAGRPDGQPDDRRGTSTMSAATAALLSGSAGSRSGVAGMLSARLKEILDDDGSLSGTTKALRRSLDASTSRADRLNAQLERTEERLLKQYAALDKNISNITNSFSSIASLLR